MKKALRILTAVILVISTVFCLAGCKSEAEKTEKEIKNTYFTDIEVSRKFKDPNGKVAYKIDYVLPHMDDTKIPQLSAFNAIVSQFEQQAESNAKTIIANKIYDKKHPWTVTADYEVTYASYNYVSVVVHFTQTTSSGKVSTWNKPIVFSMGSFRQTSLDEFSAVKSDYLKVQLTQKIISKINGSEVAAPQFAVLQAAYDFDSYTLTSEGFDIWFTEGSLAGNDKVADHYSFTFTETASLLDMPNM